MLGLENGGAEEGEEVEEVVVEEELVPARWCFEFTTSAAALALPLPETM